MHDELLYQDKRHKRRLFWENWCTVIPKDMTVAPFNKTDRHLTVTCMETCTWATLARLWVIFLEETGFLVWTLAVFCNLFPRDLPSSGLNTWTLRNHPSWIVWNKNRFQNSKENITRFFMKQKWGMEIYTYRNGGAKGQMDVRNRAKKI